MTIRSAVLIQYQRVTDVQTDIQPISINGQRRKIPKISDGGQSFPDGGQCPPYAPHIALPLVTLDDINIRYKQQIVKTF